jgi:hypothetical protein
MIFILKSADELNWFYSPEEKAIKGYYQDKIQYQWFINSPPLEHTYSRSLFEGVCEYAVSIGLLKRYPTYGDASPKPVKV